MRTHKAAKTNARHSTNGKRQILFCPNPYLLLMTMSFLVFEA